MSGKMTPENGIPYKEAVRHFISDETREEWIRAGNDAGWDKIHVVQHTPNGSEKPKSKRRNVVNALRIAESSAVNEFRKGVMEGTIVGFGYPDSVENKPKRIPPEEWSFLSWKSQDGFTFESGGRTWFRVMFHAIDDVEAWEKQIEQMRSGMLLEDALEAYSDPEIYLEADALSVFNFVVSTVEGPDTEEDRKKYRHRKLRKQLHESFVALLKSGDLQVWAFEDNESIDAPMKQIPPSKCELLDLNFQRGGTKRSKRKEALATLAGTNLHGVRFFPASIIPEGAIVETLEHTQEPIPTAERNLPAYNEVHLAWSELSQEEKDLTQTYGGKAKLANMIHTKLPQFKLPTIERELRNLLAVIQKDKERLSEH
ncbi:MAG: hypothetical protein HOJ07_13930 [Rhodospirillaceae bacterium]|jgi:hypothetical protein|nr:hypothetical protein [Rhodospirillaceae bacterium]MBT3927696.1 hypothetical protein [Rhodospirillaceae bacterium]MBT5676788.1 hypothetical protein [Rhodospirillaceae bacterium]MBT5779006.1 hypothetical protein [Rhodospirillaceae bacterium]